MKRILIAALWCSLVINAMEQEKTSTHNNDNPLYIGIVTHVLTEAIYEGEIIMVPCEKNIIVHEYSGDNIFSPVADITEKSLTAQSKELFPTLPDPSAVYYSIAPVKFSDFKPDTQDISQMGTDIKLVIAKKSYKIDSDDVFKNCHLPVHLKMGEAIKFDLEKDLRRKFRTVSCEAAFNDKGSYLPGATSNALDQVASQTNHSHPVRANINASELINPSISDTNTALSDVGRHPMSLIMAFLKVKKQNNEYIPVPTEKALIIASDTLIIPTDGK